MTFTKATYVAVILCLALAVFEIYWPRTASVAALERQLAGNHCRFSYQEDRCEQRGLQPLQRLFTEDHDCDLWAVQCLKADQSTKAVKALINVLSTKSDVETCDGVRPVRTYAVKYLGNIGDHSALAPLKRLLANKPKARLSEGASGCQPGPESLAHIRNAIKKLE